MEIDSPISSSAKVDENCVIEPKVEIQVEDDFENNPWSVEDASYFLKYCCPECDYQVLNFEMFSCHALQNHAKSKVLFEVGINVPNYEDMVPSYEENITNYGEKVTNYEGKVKTFKCSQCDSSFSSIKGKVII